MKKLSQMEAVIKVLQTVQTEATVGHSNGTTGKELLCHIWDNEPIFDKVRNDKETELAKAILLSNSADVTRLMAEIETLPAPKTVLIFKLLEPIRRLNGTKVSLAGGKTYQPVMEKVEYIYIPEDAIDLDLVAYDEVGDKAMDKHGNEVDVIRLKIMKGLLDVKEGKKNWKGDVVRNSRCYVTAISFRAMQVAGKIMFNNEQDERRVYGMEAL
jgi:hypothetical protein